MTETCTMCDAPLPPMALSVVCGDIRCRWALDQVPAARRCRACGRRLGPADCGWCPRPGCQRAAADERVAEQQRKRAVLEAHGRALRDRAAAEVGVADPQRYPLILVPSFRAGLVPVPDERRADMAAHLARTFVEALDATDEPADEPRPEVEGAGAVMGRACATCGGNCCQLGAVEHGFLTPRSLRRVRQAFPDRTPEELIEVYLGHISEAMEDSCVFHGPVGCRLPRELRGNMCNRFLCPALEAFHGSLVPGEQVRAFALSPGGGLRGEFTDGTEHRPLPPGTAWEGG